MPVPDRFADKLVLHNAFEHFEGTADTDFVAEAWRVLKPGGLVCILPLFMSGRFVNVTDPLVNRAGITYDADAQIVERLWSHNRFGRFYDLRALEARVLKPAKALGFETTIYHMANMQEIHPRVDFHFAMLMRKPR
jgi:hypothetical protein